MEASDKQPPVDKYEYFRGMSLEEIQEHLAELGEAFQGIKKHYEGPTGKLRTVMQQEDLDKILEAFSDLLPMSLNPAVQQEFAGEDIPDPADLIGNRISVLMQESLVFAARFDNTNITAFPTPPDVAARLN